MGLHRGSARDEVRGDITYIHSWQGFIYLATVIDCYTKKVVGWSIADHMRTELVADALRNAAATTRIEADAIWHSDRGSVGRFNRYLARGIFTILKTVPDQHKNPA